MKKDDEQRIKDLLGKMTVQEKIGQLHQSGPSIVGAFNVDLEEAINMVYDGRISKAKFDEMMSSENQDYHENDLREGKIGSYNGVSDAKTIYRLQKIAVEESRLGIPLLFGYDVLHGFRTITPIPLGESCAWDPDLWERTARMSADEATSAGINMTYAPMVDVSKDARWGRISEGAGEDTLLACIYGVSKVRGFQTDDLARKDALAACVKHFAAYGACESGRDYNRVDMSMQKLFEEYLPPYEACVKAGSRGVMSAFTDLNGLPCTVNRWLLTEILRDDWGFTGMVISDAGAIAECVIHGISEDKANASLQAIKAGVDVDMISGAYAENIESLIESGVLDIQVLDRAVMNVLQVKSDLNLFDDPYQTGEEREKKAMLTIDNRKLALEAAVKSMVLLKNDGILPLKKDMRIGIVGSLATNSGEMTGTWAIKAQGNDCVSILDACIKRGINHIYFDNPGETGNEDVDVFIVAVGESKIHSGEAASRANIDLSQENIGTVKQLAETGKPVIAVMFNGRPLSIPRLCEDVSAILEAWHPGVEAGNAILDLLFGIENPSGKLTTTFPHAAGQCPVYYDHINTPRPAGSSKYTSKYLDIPSLPVFPFGYGLSYTSYSYSDLQVKRCNEGISVSIKVENTGKRQGEEIVQCYIRDLAAKRVRPVKRLVDFIRINLEPGEIKNVNFHIVSEKTGYYDWDMKFTKGDGKVEVSAGGCSNDCLSKIIYI